MSGIIVAAVYSVYSVQQRANSKQEQIMEVQQTLRVALYMMGQEIRMAGLDPEGAGDRGFDTAEDESVAFSYSERIDPSGNPPRWKKVSVSYSIKEKDGEKSLIRGGQPFAENIENLEFYYTLKNGSQTLTPSPLNDIRAITISILGRAKNPDGGFTDTKTYSSASGENWTPTDKHYRRQLFITTIQCRNMGL